MSLCQIDVLEPTSAATTQDRIKIPTYKTSNKNIPKQKQTNVNKNKQM